MDIDIQGCDVCRVFYGILPGEAKVCSLRVRRRGGGLGKMVDCGLSQTDVLGSLLSLRKDD